MPARLPPYKGRPDAGSGGMVPRRDSNAQLASPSTGASAIGLRGHGAATRCRPGPSALRRRSRSRARRRELPDLDSNQCCQGSEPRWDARQPTRYRVRAAGFELSQHSGSPGFEPRAAAVSPRPRTPPGSRTPYLRLRVRCFTGMLAARRADNRNRTRDVLVGSQVPEPFGHFRMVGPAGNDPASPGLQPGANPSELETRGREARTRTPSTWSQARCANPYATSRGWTASDSNRDPPGCKPGALPN